MGRVSLQLQRARLSEWEQCSKGFWGFLCTRLGSIAKSNSVVQILPCLTHLALPMYAIQTCKQIWMSKHIQTNTMHYTTLCKGTHVFTHTLHLVLPSEDISSYTHLLQLSAINHDLIHVFSSHEHQPLRLHSWTPLWNPTIWTLKICHLQIILCQLYE